MSNIGIRGKGKRIYDRREERERRGRDIDRDRDREREQSRRNVRK